MFDLLKMVSICFLKYKQMPLNGLLFNGKEYPGNS